MRSECAKVIGVCGICRGSVSQPVSINGAPNGEPATCGKCGAQAKWPFPVLEMVTAPHAETVEIAPEGKTVAIEFDRPIGERDPDDCNNCHRCVGPWEGIFDRRMIVCATCGNKRCPRATDHRLACSNSNEPGQEGSCY